MKKENEILENAHDAVLERPFEFNIVVNPKDTTERLLMWLRIRPRVLKLSIEPTVFGARVWFSKYLVGVELTKEDLGNDELALNHRATIDFTERMAKAMAAIIHNRNSEPPKWLVDAILNNVTASEYLFLVKLLREFVNPKDFLHSIISAAGMSLNKQEELIASTQTPGK